MSRISPDSSWLLDADGLDVDHVGRRPKPCNRGPGRSMPVPGVNPNGDPSVVSDRSPRTKPIDGPLQKPVSPPKSIAHLVATQGTQNRSPAMAPRERSATVTERPSIRNGHDALKTPFNNATPGVPNNKRMSRDDFHLPIRRAGTALPNNKRMSRDDFHLPVRLAGGERLQSTYAADRPRRGPPHFSPLGHPQKSAAPQQMIRTNSPDLMMEREDQGQILIGMAVSTPPSSQNDGHRPLVTRALTAPIDEYYAYDEGTTKQKPRKWGIFGRSKSKREKAPGHLTSSQGSNESFDSLQRTTSKASLPRREADSYRAPKHKPIVIRSHTEPMPRNDHRSHDYSQLQDKSVKKPLLNVEIPKIELERYSVMFGSVLQQQGQASSEPRQSLLVRRQATLNKLKTIEDRAMLQTGSRQHAVPHELAGLPMPRRATSPQPKGSPTFSLFPAHGKTELTPATQSPRPRSNTSPAFLPSPSQEAFTLASSHDDSPLRTEARMAIPRQVVPNSGPSAHRSSKHRQLEESPTKQLPGSSKNRSRTRLSPTSEADEDGVIHIHDRWVPSPSEPTWRMMSPPSSSTTASRVTQAAAPGTPARSQGKSAISPPPPPPKEHVDENPAAKALRDAVETSIARQINMSQQQRNLLLTLDSKVAKRKNASPSGVGIAKPGLPRITIGHNEVLTETKSSTPTLVHPYEHQMLNTPRGMHVHRKSEQIVLEAV